MIKLNKQNVKFAVEIW